MPSAPIFISYSRRNRDAVRQIYSRMEAAGYPLWRDLSDLEPGDKWWPQIQEAIDACDSMVLCMSVESLLSTVVGDEWNYARQHGKRVIPAVVDEVFKHPRVESGEVKIPRWMSDADWLDLREDAPESDLHWQRLFKTLNTPYEPRRRPMMIPRLPDQYIDRPQEKEPVIEALLDADNRAVALTTALKGAGGYGKTTLACAIARDVRVSGAYDDGLLFVTLGESLTESALIAKVLDLIETITQQRPALADSNAARVALNDAIGDRNILLVVDDVWDAAHLAPFLVEGPRCAKLITTRNERLLPAGAQRHLIDQMRPDEALALLTWGLPPAPPALHERLTALADRLGRWAQVLKMVNGVLRQQTAQGQTLAGALDYVGEGLTEEGLEAFDDPSSTNQRHRTARAALAVSLRQLKDDADRAAFAQLAIFPEDADVPLAVLEKLWGRSGFKTRALCDTFFAGLALLQEYNAGAGTLRLHDVIRADLRVQHQESLVGWNTALLAAFGDLYSLPHPYAWRFYAYHLLETGQADRLRALLLDYRWLRAKLEVLDAAALIADCDAWLNAPTAAPPETRESMRLLHSALTNSEHVLATDKDALAHQLVGRLMLHRRQQPDIRALTDAAQRTGGFRLVNPDSEYPVLNPAGGHLLRTLAGHTGVITSAIVLDDGRILSWSYDHTLRLWSSHGTPLAVLDNHTGAISGAMVLDDGRILSWSYDHTLRLWSSHGTPLAVLDNHTGAISDAMVLDDGRILSWGKDHTLRLWSSHGIPLAVLDNHTAEISGAMVLDDGRILSWGKDHTLRLWSSHGTPLAVLDNHTAEISGAMVLDDGRILSWGKDHTLRLWSSHGTPLAVLDNHTAEISGAMVLDDGRILSWGKDHTLRLWSSHGTPLAVLDNHTGAISGAMVLDDGRILSWSYDHTLRLWSSHGTPLAVLDNHTGAISGAMVLDDGRILSWGWDGTPRIWSSRNTTSTVLDGHTDSVQEVQLLPDGRFLSWSEDKTLRLWSPAGVQLAVFKGHTDRIRGAQILPNDRFMSWGWDGTLRLWSSQGIPSTILEAHTDRIMDMQTLPDGRFLSQSIDRTLRLWSSHGIPLAALKIWRSDRERLSGLAQKHGFDVSLLLTETDEPTLGSLCVTRKEQKLILYDPATGATRAVFHGDAEITALAVLTDGETVAVGDASGRVFCLRYVPPAGSA